MSLESDRDRRYTAASVLQRIDHDTDARLHSAAAAGPAAIDARIAELLAAPAMVGAAVFLHATTGSYPLLPLFRRLASS